MSTSNIGMSILRNILQHRHYFVDNIISLKIWNNILQLTVSDASDLGLDVIEVFCIVRQEHLELFFSH